MTGAYAALVAYMSLRPFGHSPVERAIDKVGRGYFHLPAYAGLALLIALASSPRRSRGRRVLVAGAAATAYGWLVEVAQIPAPTRTFNVEGLLLDVAGALVGSAAAFYFLRWVETSRRARNG